MRIAIDIDETILTCNSILYRFFNKVFRNKVGNKNKFVNLDKSEILNNKKVKRAWIFYEENYVEIDGAIQVIKNWKKLKNEVTLLSSRPAWAVLKQMIFSWLDKKELEINNVVFSCKSKWLYCKQFNMDFFIDDSLKQCEVANQKGIRAICFSQNPKVNSNSVIVARSWSEIENIINDEQGLIKIDLAK